MMVPSDSMVKSPRCNGKDVPVSTDKLFEELLRLGELYGEPDGAFELNELLREGGCLDALFFFKSFGEPPLARLERFGTEVDDDKVDFRLNDGDVCVVESDVLCAIKLA